MVKFQQGHRDMIGVTVSEDILLPWMTYQRESRERGMDLHILRVERGGKLKVSCRSEVAGVADGSWWLGPSLWGNVHWPDGRRRPTLSCLAARR